MDGDSKRKKHKVYKNNFANARNFFQPAWVRCAIQGSDELDWFLLDYGFGFLPSVSILFWIVLLFS